MSTSRQLKGDSRPLNEKSITNSNKGHLPAMLLYHPPLTSFRPPYQQHVSILPQAQSQMYQIQVCNELRPRKTLEKNNAHLDPIPKSYGQVLPYLINNSLVFPNPLKVFPSSISHGYDSNIKCGFHVEPMGHSIDNYEALKARFHKFIEDKSLVFKEEDIISV